MSLVIAAQDSRIQTGSSGLHANMRTAALPLSKVTITATKVADKRSLVPSPILNQIKAALGVSSINIPSTNTWEQQ
jgi:hypothetical protein